MEVTFAGRIEIFSHFLIYSYCIRINNIHPDINEYSPELKQGFWLNFEEVWLSGLNGSVYDLLFKYFYLESILY